MSEQNDTKLVFLALQGDKTAFGQLVWRYQPMAHHLAKGIIRNEDLAQELVQDSMLQAYLSLNKLRDPNCFKSWLYGIVLNVCRNYLRRRKVVPFSLETIVVDLGTEPLSIYGSSPDPQQIAEQQELQAELHEAFDTLSDKNRLVTLLFYQEQFSLQEIADRLHISVGAVKGRLHRSRHQLKKQLLPLQDQTQTQSTLLQEQEMTNNAVSYAEIKRCCSFCDKDVEQVQVLIGGPGVYICDECVNLCNKIISHEISRLTKEEVESFKTKT